MVQNKTKSTMFIFLIFIINIIIVTSADLRQGYYSKTCPQAETIVRDVMRNALKKEPRSVASVMRFQFHDCFVNVCSLYTLVPSKFNIFNQLFFRFMYIFLIAINYFDT